MQLADERTLETLDFARVRDRVVRETRTDRGRSFAQQLAPLVDFARVIDEQAATAEMREVLVQTDLYVMPAVDTHELGQRASIGTTLAATELRSVGDAIAACAAAQEALRAHPSPALESLAAQYRSLKAVQRSLTDALDERGAVQDRASPALARIRRNIQQAQADARDRVTALLRSSKYARAIQDAVVTIREGRFVIPIKAEFGGEVPGIVHDTSSSGQTLFMEPLGALEANNRLRTLRSEEEYEIRRILEALSRMVGEHAAQIETNAGILAQIDLVVAKARVAAAMDARAPELLQTPTLAVDEGRHPLLGDRAVAQSLALDDERRIILISGPNMGGKTVALKMVGLFVAMAYAGMQIPAGPGTRIGRFTRIFTDIGDEQSIAANTSTFSAHLSRMREILDSADERSIVLVDEIGGGTEPSSGAALAIAMLERLLEVRACGIVTTHATELKLFASQADGILNASVRFNPATFSPTYQLDVGTPGQSLAFSLARTLGIAPTIVQRAQSLLGSRERDYESALNDLSERSTILQSEREALAREQRHVDRLQDNARARLEALERERREFAQAAEGRMQEALRNFAAELAQRAAERQSTRPKVTSGQSALLQQTIDRMRSELGVQTRTPQDAVSGAFEAGEAVRVISFDQDATVIADNGASLLVAIGHMRTVVARNDVRRRAGASRRVDVPRRSEGGAATLDAAARTTSELDVRGKRYVEAQPVVDQWIDEALLAGNTPLRLIHGKGTGMLGRGLQEYLKSHPAVKAVRYGDETEGGGGVTIVDLR